MKYSMGDVLIVFKGTPTYEEGGVVRVIDRDPNDKTYAVAHLYEVGKADFDVPELLKNYVKWVSEDNLSPISYYRPSRLEVILSSIKELYHKIKDKIRGQQTKK